MAMAGGKSKHEATRTRTFVACYLTVSSDYYTSTLHNSIKDEDGYYEG